jgi:ABC-type phosphate/phosphonate transport system substrate-binding protein
MAREALMSLFSYTPQHPLHPLVEESSKPKDDVDKVIELLYDMHANPNADKKEMARLLGLYKDLTGKDKPLFMA